jgi:L-2-hydroxyglutarate oxidase LhgO
MKNIVFTLIFIICGGGMTAQIAHNPNIMPDTVGINIRNKNFVYLAKKIKGDDMLI